MKNFYIAVIIKEDNKYYAYTVKANESDNLLRKLKIKNIIIANICNTMSKAEETINEWNKSFKNNGIYLFEN